MPYNSKGKLHGTGKKPHKFTYTYNDISLLTGLSINTIRQYASKGKLKPHTLREVILFISRQKAQS